MDGAEKAEEEEVMILPAGYSDDARALWNAATALNRAAAAVSPAAATLPPMLFFTDPDRTTRPWETAAGSTCPNVLWSMPRAFARTDPAGF
jgi:thiamine-phosphate pyrophosphorylase